MSDKFQSVEIEKLTHAECRELLKTIEDLVCKLPPYLNNVDCGFVFTPYSCCSGYEKLGHDKNCSVDKLNKIFGY